MFICKLGKKIYFFSRDFYIFSISFSFILLGILGFFLFKKFYLFIWKNYRAGRSGWSQEPVDSSRSPIWAQEPEHWAVLCYFPRHISEELDGEWSSWNSNRCPDETPASHAVALPTTPQKSVFLLLMLLSSEGSLYSVLWWNNIWAYRVSTLSSQRVVNEGYICLVFSYSV